MEDYNPNELVTVCESILEDGKISGDELYRLAEWLNGHREACFHWPGDLLVKPLQEVWADGKVTETEMMRIGRLLVQIRKDWAKRQAEAAFDRPAVIAAQVVQSVDLSQPRMAAIPFVLFVKSHTDTSVRYTVDLSGPTCTCPDWHSRRSELPQGHLSRCCKHVFDAYGELEPETDWPGWLGAFLDLSWPPHPQQDWMVLRIGRRYVLASTAPTGWANFYAEVDGNYDRFGYNVIEDRWAYGMEPTGSGQIRRAIADATNR